MFWKKIKSKEYLELKQDLESLRIRFEGMQIEFDLVIRKLKVKYKIPIKDKEEEETKNIKNAVLLPSDDGI